MHGSNGAVAFGHFALEWKARQVHRPTTSALVDWLIAKHMLPFFGDRDLRELRPGDVQTWIRHRSERLSSSTMEVLYQFFAAICAAAVADGLIARNPCAGIKAPRAERPPIVAPTPVHVRAVIDAMEDRYRAVVVLAAGTGLRSGECLGLGVDRIDFDEGIVTVDRQLVLPSNGPPRLGPPKTRASYRRVPLPDTVADALRTHVATYPLGPDDLVFTSARGRPVRRNRLNEGFRATVAAAGVPRRIRFHDLRVRHEAPCIRAG